MRLTLAGCPLSVGPDDALDARELRSLKQLAAAGAAAVRGPGETFHLEIVEHLPWAGATLDEFPDEGPAAVEAAGNGVRVTHRRFAATLDLGALSGRLYRADPGGGATEIALRVALAARLPALGTLPLHAAGLVLEGTGHVFFGPSGAGKSTLASQAPGPVLSDELVAASVEPPELRSTGFWGTFDEGGPTCPSAPLGTLVELGRGPSFRLDRLAPDLALRRLLAVLMVPPVPSLWSQAMGLAARLAHAVPVYRMEWAPGEPPWEDFRRALLSS